MDVVVLEDAEAVARHAACAIAEILRMAVLERGLGTVALSGGRTPGRMFDHLSREAIPWAQVHVFQCDERLAPRDHAARNAGAIRGRLVEPIALPEGRLHLMPVDAVDVEAGARAYESGLRAVAGAPPRLDIVHLGLGEDGHTASLFPGDAVAWVRDRDVAVTKAHAGWRRMTLTTPVLEQARHRVWVVCGHEKQQALQALLAGDPSIPAGRLPQQRALVVADRAALAPQEPERA